MLCGAQVLQVAKNLRMWSAGGAEATYSELLAKDSDVAKVVHMLTGSLEGLRQQTTDYLSESVAGAACMASILLHSMSRMRSHTHMHAIGVQGLLVSLSSFGRLIFKQRTRPSWDPLPLWKSARAS